MGIRLVMEAATHAGPGLTWRERFALSVLAASAIDATRACPAGIETRPEIIERLHMGRSERYAVLASLCAKGALIKTERGRNGVRAAYSIAVFTTAGTGPERPGEPDAPPVDNPPDPDPAPVDSSPEGPENPDASPRTKGPGTTAQGSGNPGLKPPGNPDPSRAGTSYRGVLGIKARGGTPPAPPPGPPPRLYAVPVSAPEEGAGIPEGNNPASHGQAARRHELAAEILAIRSEWSRRSVLRALEQPDVAERPWPVVADAMRHVAADPATKSPGRLRHDGPWWHQAARAAEAAPEWPPWCGSRWCSERTRRREHPVTGRDDGPCPGCHPDPAKARTA